MSAPIVVEATPTDFIKCGSVFSPKTEFLERCAKALKVSFVKYFEGETAVVRASDGANAMASPCEGDDPAVTMARAYRRCLMQVLRIPRSYKQRDLSRKFVFSATHAGAS